MKKVYNGKSAPLDAKTYNAAEDKQSKKYTLFPDKPDTNKEIKAMWDKEYSLSYNENKGKTCPPEQKGTFGIDLSGPSQKQDSKTETVAAAIERDGYTFKGWKDEEANKVYQPKDTVTLTFEKPKVTLTAVWEKVPEKVEITTKYVDQNGNNIQDPIKGDKEGEQKVFEGYTFVRKETNGNEVKYIYKKEDLVSQKPQPSKKTNQSRHSYFFLPLEPKKDTEVKKYDRLIEKHLAYIFGYPDNTVRPKGTLTRAEAAAMVTRLGNLDLYDKSKANYPDLKDGAWYLPYINAALKVGMLDTDAKGNLRPDEPVTRAEFIKMISVIDKAEQGKAFFKDIAGHRYEKEINQVYSNKHIAGYEDGSFKPDSFLTRAEAAAFLNRVFDRVADAKAIEGFENKIYKFKDLDKSTRYYNELVEATNSHELVRRDAKDSMDRTFERWNKLLNYEYK
ncbi:S-layer homology domain-containing protein [Peptoniphilus vaginalis]|uniref:S-layer homology domain-containing protein n=1 Tax=Peptoniphilus vaginalis TaxID=1756987 RepID=UPI0023F89A6C|nr:S-layer homology domain-containing protein [Peptoniphilus vaginalis]